MNCPETNSIDHYKHQVRTNFFWFHYVKQKAIKNNISIDEALEAGALWMVENN